MRPADFSRAPRAMAIAGYCAVSALTAAVLLFSHPAAANVATVNPDWQKYEPQSLIGDTFSETGTPAAPQPQGADGDAAAIQRYQPRSMVDSPAPATPPPTSYNADSGAAFHTDNPLDALNAQPLFKAQASPVASPVVTPSPAVASSGVVVRAGAQPSPVAPVFPDNSAEAPVTPSSYSLPPPAAAPQIVKSATAPSSRITTLPAQNSAPMAGLNSTPQSDTALPLAAETPKTGGVQPIEAKSRPMPMPFADVADTVAALPDPVGGASSQDAAIAKALEDKLETLERENQSLREKAGYGVDDKLADIRVDAVAEIREQALRDKIAELQNDLDQARKDKDIEGLPQKTAPLPGAKPKPAATHKPLTKDAL